MDPNVYKVIHLTGVVGLFTALGSLISTTKGEPNKFGGALHGIALILILISGFGMMAKTYENNFYWWMIVKLIVWFGLGAMLAVAKRQVLPREATSGIVLALGIIAAWLGIYGKMM